MDSKNLSRIPRRYKHTQTKVSAVDMVEKIRIRGSFLGEFDPSSSNRISWYLPNPKDRFLDGSSIELRGQVLVDTTSAGGDTYAQIMPSIGGTYTGMNLVIERQQLYIGSTLMEESLNQRLLSSMNIGLKTNSIWRLTQEPYENAGKFVAGQTAAEWRDFRVRLSFRNSELFGSTSEELVSQDFLIPVGWIPRMQLDLFFADPAQIINVDTGLTGPITPSYKLRNLELDTLYLKSAALSNQMNTMGWSITWTAHLFQERIVPAGSVGKISTELPSAFAQAQMAMVIYQQPGEDTTLTLPNRTINASDELSAITQANIRVNGLNRYQEPLDQVDMYREVIRNHSTAEFSDFYNTDLATLTTTSNYVVMLIGRDYPSPALISGINSAQATGSIVVEVTFTNALTSTHNARSFLSYARNLTCKPNGAVSVTF